tara:strand:- start:5898 stop:6542 length:645 start_codon:yes stop_codon:yes gene_type:complete
MKSNFINFFWDKTQLKLYSSRTLFIPQTNEMLISDIHLGKSEYFQSRGIPLTNNQDKANLKRIYESIDQLKPKKLVILGDLFHSQYSITEDLIKKLKKLSMYMKNRIELIVGNHDRGCFVKDIKYLKEKRSMNLIFTHEPIKFKEKNILNICGHYHPKLILKNKQDKLSFRCFALDKNKNTLFLPSYGDLTGGYLCTKEMKKWAIVSKDLIYEI